MATTIRLEHLLPQGEPDREGCSFTISRESYEELPVLPEKIFSSGNWVIDRTDFKEVYRGSNSYRPAVKLYDEREVIPNPLLMDDQIYWYILWIEEEKVWVVFKYYDLASLDDTYTSTVEVSLPEHGEIYRPNEAVNQIINQHYNFN